MLNASTVSSPPPTRARVSCAGWVMALCAGFTACGPAADDAPQPGASAAAARADRPPNIVLLISDDHDWQQFGFMGASPSPTPALDELAAGGLLFTEGSTAPRCRPALAGLLSGRHPHQSGFYSNASRRVLRGPNLLPKLLSGAGYACYAEGKFWEGSPRPVGFEFGPDAVAGEVGLNASGFVREGQAQLFRFLEGVGDTPFFVWWAPMLPHVPHTPPAELLAQVSAAEIAVPDWIAAADRAAFIEAERKSLAMVRWLDNGVAELREQLRELDLERETLFVFLCDNGWANGQLSKGSPYEKGVRTPVILSWPGHVEAGRRSQLVSYLDLLPTLLDYAGIAVPKRAVGHSLRPWAEGREVPWRDALFGACYATEASADQRPESDLFAQFARTDRYKYVRWVRPASAGAEQRLYNVQDLLVGPWARRAGQEELFDLQRDPLERVDLAAEPSQAVRLAELRGQLDEWWADTGGGRLPR